MRGKRLDCQLPFIDGTSHKLKLHQAYSAKLRLLKKLFKFSFLFLWFSHPSCYIGLMLIRVLHSILCPFTLGETDMSLSVKVPRENVGKNLGCLFQNLE